MGKCCAFSKLLTLFPLVKPWKSPLINQVKWPSGQYGFVCLIHSNMDCPIAMPVIVTARCLELKMRLTTLLHSEQVLIFQCSFPKYYPCLTRTWVLCWPHIHLENVHCVVTLAVKTHPRWVGWKGLDTTVINQKLVLRPPQIVLYHRKLNQAHSIHVHCWIKVTEKLQTSKAVSICCSFLTFIMLLSPLLIITKATVSQCHRPSESV